MKRVQLVLALLVACGALSTARSAHAQRGRGLLSPTLSPWLNLYRRDAGPLGPYLSDVRPEQRLRRTLQQHGTSIRRQGVGLGALGQQMNRFETGSMRPTGIGAGFMNYSHYYQFPGSSAGRRSAPRLPAPRRTGRSYTSEAAISRVSRGY